MEKNKFTIKYRNELTEFARLETPQEKCDFVNKHVDENFSSGMKLLYGEYINYLTVSIQRGILTDRINDMLLAESDNISLIRERIAIESDVENIEHTTFLKSELLFAEKKFKRLNKILKKLKRKIKYRLRASYFDNYMVTDWIVQHKEIGHPVYMSLIFQQVDEIIIRQIKRKNLHKFSVELEDLVQDLRGACLTAIERFDESKGKTGRAAFNYFSIICIKAGRFATNRKSNRQKREIVDSVIVEEVLIGSDDTNVVRSKDHYYTDEDTVSFSEDLLKSFYNYYYNEFKSKDRLVLLLQLLVRYILLKQLTFKKSEFVKFVKSYGFTNAFIHKFLNSLKDTRSKFFEYHESKRDGTLIAQR